MRQTLWSVHIQFKHENQKLRKFRIYLKCILLETHLKYRLYYSNDGKSFIVVNKDTNTCESQSIL